MTISDSEVNVERKTKKRKAYGKMEDVIKKIRLASHETG